MKNGCIHICFVIDESGSMFGQVRDVLGGLRQVLEEQRGNEHGGCVVSLFRFNDVVSEDFVGKDIRDIDVDAFKYYPGGATAMNDGIGVAIDTIGQWLSDMGEDERPEKNLVVIMTDGEENCSKNYTFDSIKSKIEEQTKVYNWSFVYMGTDIANKEYADKLGVACTNISREMHYKNYTMVSALASSWRDIDAHLKFDEKNKLFECAVHESVDKFNSQDPTPKVMTNGSEPYRYVSSTSTLDSYDFEYPKSFDFDYVLHGTNLLHG